MKIHEYQAKAILARHGVPVPRGEVAFNAVEAGEIARRLGSPVVVVKAQIHAGGRGKGGGVKVAKSPEEAEAVAGRMIGMTLITHQTGPEGRVVSRVLVEEGVEEGEAGLPDTRSFVDERKLPETSGALVDRDLLPHYFGGRVGLDTHDRACTEGDLQALDHRPVQRQRPCCANDPVCPAAVRGHEDLLGRHVRHERSAVDAVAAAAPERLWEQPDHEVGAGAVEADCVELQLVQVPSSRIETCDVRPPGGVRAGLPTTVFYGRDGKVAFVHQGQYRDEAALVADVKRYAERS